MLAEVVLTNWQAGLLYWLAFLGCWHVIGIPPVMEWFRKDKDNADS